MVRNRIHYAVAAALVATLALAGCKKKEEATMTPPAATEPAPMPPMQPAPSAMPVTVLAVDLGTAVGADNKVASSMSTFGAKDTIYAAVTTDGSANNARLGAKWTFGTPPTTVNEESKTLSTTGPATTEFHISKPDGFPVGKYRVEITLDGAVVQSRDFEVK